MVDGRIRKYYEEVVLLEQLFVIDGETKISKVVENAAKSLGVPVKLTGFVRYALGEGIEKEQKDFAAEVAAPAGPLTTGGRPAKRATTASRKDATAAGNGVSSLPAGGLTAGFWRSFIIPFRTDPRPKAR